MKIEAYLFLYYLFLKYSPTVLHAKLFSSTPVWKLRKAKQSVLIEIYAGSAYGI